MKDDSGSYAVFTEQGSSASQTDGCKRNGYYIKTTRMRKTSSRRSICLHPSQNGGCTHCWKFQSHNVQIFGFVYHDTNGQNHGPVWKTQSFLLKGICTVILLQDYLWERQFENLLLEHGWEKVPNWECLFVNREKGLF